VSAPGHTATLLAWAREVQALAQTGLAFTRDPYDRERYDKLQALAQRVLQTELGAPAHATADLWRGEHGYATPKVDVRGAVFRDAEVLLVRERSDGRWTVPGGWVDVNDSPSGAVVREVREESGFTVRPVKLAAVIDKSRHPHPPGVHHIYKLMFLCELQGGAASPSDETDAVDFFPLQALPELSTGRILPAQIERLYRHHLEPGLPTDFD